VSGFEELILLFWTLEIWKQNLEKTMAFWVGNSSQKYPKLAHKPENQIQVEDPNFGQNSMHNKSDKFSIWVFKKINYLVVEPTHLKNMLVNLDHFPNFRGENKICIKTTT